MEGSKRQQTLDLRRGSEKNSFQVFAFQAPDVSLTNTSYFLLVLSRFSKILVDLTLSCALLPQSGVFYTTLVATWMQMATLNPTAGLNVRTRTRSLSCAFLRLQDASYRYTVLESSSCAGEENVK
jgi:hypothetical protein